MATTINESSSATFVRPPGMLDLTKGVSVSTSSAPLMESSGSDISSEGSASGGAGSSSDDEFSMMDDAPESSDIASLIASAADSIRVERQESDGETVDSTPGPKYRQWAGFFIENPEFFKACVEGWKREQAGEDMRDEWILTDPGTSKYVAEVEEEKAKPLEKIYRQQEDQYWLPEEIDFSSDPTDWRKIGKRKNGKKIQKMLFKTFAFFAASDGIVNESVFYNLISEVQNWAARASYAIQGAIENVHGRTYNLILRMLVEATEGDMDHRTMLKELQNAAETNPMIKIKAQWAIKHIEDKTMPFSKRIFAFACVEGIMFSAAFAIIFWLKKQGLMPGVCFSNELISRDEGMHTENARLNYDTLEYTKLHTHEAHEIVHDAVKTEMAFVDDMIPEPLLGINAQSMKVYVMFVADHLLSRNGLPKLYKVSNPFEWMDLISLSGKTNFFEKKVGEYAKSGDTSDKAEDIFTLDADF